MKARSFYRGFVRPPPPPDADEIAAELARKESAAEILRLKARHAELQKKVARLRAELAAKGSMPESRFREPMIPARSKYDWPIGEDKILFLPAGRMRRSRPRWEFTVDQEMTDKLNAHREAVLKLGVACWLDLNHDWKTEIFSPITGFEFVEGEGVWAIGLWTGYGQALRDAGRVSGLSINMTAHNGRSVNRAYPMEISDYDLAQLPPPEPASPPSRTPNEMIRSLAILGGVLTDGQRSFFQPYRTQAERWKEILEGMARTGAIVIEEQRAADRAMLK
jgi:hypothetical protein